MKSVEHEATEYFKYAMVFYPEWPENESSFLDNEYMQVMAYEFADVPGRKMQIRIGTRDNQVAGAFFAFNEETYLADATDISWLERSVSRN